MPDDIKVRLITIAPGVREAVARHAESRPPRTVTFAFTDCNGVRWADVVVCGRCGFSSDNLNLDRCPADGAVLGETSVRVASDPGGRLHTIGQRDCPGCVA